MAAMVAYNLMLSVFPFALLVLFITGQLLQSADVQASILRDLQELFPSTEQDTLQSTLDQLQSSSTEIGIVAIVAGLWIGASFWGAMDTAFCRIYHVECRGWIEQKRFSLIMLLVVAVFLAASVSVPALESLVASGVDDLPFGLDEHRLARQRRLHLRRAADQLPDPLPDLLGRAQGAHALAQRLARRPVHGDRRRASPTSSSRSTWSTSRRSASSAASSPSCSSPCSGSTRWRSGCSPARVINALRHELHDTGTVRGMTAEFDAPKLEEPKHDAA